MRHSFFTLPKTLTVTVLMGLAVCQAALADTAKTLAGSSTFYFTINNQLDDDVSVQLSRDEVLVIGARDTQEVQVSLPNAGQKDQRCRQQEGG